MRNLKEIVAKLREDAHQMESPYWEKDGEPDWAYVAKAFKEIADELDKVLANVRNAVCTNAGIPYDEGAAAALRALGGK